MGNRWYNDIIKNFSLLFKKKNPYALSTELKYKFKIFSGLLILLAVISPLTIILYGIFDPTGPFIINRGFIIKIISALSLLPLFLLNRRGYYNLTITLFLCLSAFTIFYLAAFQKEENPGFGIFFYLLIPVALSTFLITFKQAAFYTVVNLALLCSIYLLNDLQPDSGNELYIIVIIAILSCFFLFTAYSGIKSAQEQIKEIKLLAENALLEQKKEYLALVDNLRDFLVKTDPQGNLLFTSRSFRLFYNLEENKIQGRNILEFAHPGNRPNLKINLQNLIKPPYTCYVEYKSLTSRGPRWIGWKANAILDEKNRPVALLSTGRDITARKETEEKLRLEMEKARYYLDVAAVIIVAISKDQRIILINSKGCEILGSSEQEIVGKNWFDNFIPSPIRQEVKDVFNQCMEDKIRAVEYYENPIITRNGSTRIIAWYNTLLRDKSGQPYCTLSSGEDITERKKAEQERELLIKELETRNARLEQFSYTVSHDLKSPLITIKGFLSILEEDSFAGRTDALKSDLNFIHNAVNKMWNLLNDLLRFSKLGRFTEIFTEIPFKEIVEESVKLVTERLTANKVRLRVAENFPLVKGDRTRLIELIVNLIDNAAKFTSNSRIPEIEIGVQQTAGNNIFFVRDNGIGIDPVYQHKVFDLFHQLNPHTGGTGIGLTLVKRIVEIHNGTIWVESTGLDSGTTFYFTLTADTCALPAENVSAKTTSS